MALSRVQATPVGHAFNGTTTLTFAVTPGAGNMIAVAVSAWRNGSGYTLSTPHDNQGNTYHAGATVTNGGATGAHVFFAYNIAASGTFTVTVSCTGGGASTTEVEAVAIELFGTGTANPLVGSGTMSGSTSLSVTTGPTASPEVFVVAVLSGIRLNFNVTSITVGVKVPPFLQEYERLSSSPFTLVCEADSRIDNTGTASGAQSCSWTASAVPASPCAAIAAFYSDPPVASVLWTQEGRQVLEIESPVSVNWTQMGRQVLYPFTCTPGSLQQMRITQLPVEAAYDYSVIQPFLDGAAFDWVTPPKDLP